jgi:acylphosphatase
VRNLPDGRVEAELQGEPDAVAAVAGWCRQGPVLARVERVDIVELAPLAGADGFHVR